MGFSFELDNYILFRIDNLLKDGIIYKKLWESIQHHYIQPKSGKKVIVVGHLIYDF